VVAGCHWPAPLGARSPGGQRQLPAGRLHLSWAELPPRRIALLKMPRLQVAFQFEGLDAAERYRFMKRFDLYMQRGGG